MNNTAIDTAVESVVEADVFKMKKINVGDGLEFFAVGDTALLFTNAVPVGTSNNPTPLGVEIGKKLGISLAEAGYNIIIGGMRTSDLVIINAAMEGGGKVIVVLPMGMGKMEWTDDVKRHVQEGNLLVISQYPKNTPWTQEQGQERNRALLQISNLNILMLTECAVSIKRGLIVGGVFDLLTAAVTEGVMVCLPPTTEKSPWGHRLIDQIYPGSLVFRPDFGQINSDWFRETLS